MSLTTSLSFSSSDPFATVAPFYNLDLRDYNDDVSLYRLLAERSTGSVLELGCGTGRVALALAGDGHDVVGVDMSTGMLEIANRHDHSNSVRWIRGDMRALDLDREFGLILVPLGGLQHMQEIDDLVATMTVIAHHLSSGGVAVVDVEAPIAEDFTSGSQPLIEHWTREWQSQPDDVPAMVSKLVQVEVRAAQSRRDVTWHYDIQGSDVPLRRVTAQFVLRTITYGELELAGRLAGLQLSTAWGDYEMTPYDDRGERLMMSFINSESSS